MAQTTDRQELEALREELANRDSELENIRQAGILITSSLDIERILALLMELGIAEVMAEVGAILLVEKENISTAISWGLGEEIIHRVGYISGEKVLDSVIATGQPAVSVNTETDEALARIDEFEFIKNFMFVPLVAHGSVVGVMVVINKQDAEGFDDKDLEHLSSLAGFSAVAIENARLHATELEKEKMEQELKVAHNIQMGLLPCTPPKIENVSMKGLCFPAKDVGGDYYDYLDLGDGYWGILIADVSSKGTPAALMMSMARIVFRVIAQSSRSPAEIVARVNAIIHDDMSISSGMFVTLFLGVLDTSTMTMSYTNAGHCPTIIVRRETPDSPTDLIELKTGDLFVGFDKDMQYHENSVRLLPGDLVVFYTDGVTDVLNSSEDVYGPQRFMKLLRDKWELSLTDLSQAVFNDVMSFAGATEVASMQYDDFTLVLLRYHDAEQDR